MSIIKLKLSKKRGKWYAVFINFFGSFWSMHRAALIYKLYNLGVSFKVINPNRSDKFKLYKQLSYKIEANNYFLTDRKMSDVKWILKVRGELLNLN